MNHLVIRLRRLGNYRLSNTQEILLFLNDSLYCKIHQKIHSFYVCQLSLRFLQLFNEKKTAFSLY